MQHITIILLVCFALVVPHNAIITSWEYPYNEATYRTYVAHGAKIAYISESGEDGFIEFDGTHNPQDTVTLFGRAFGGEITLIPDNPSCWFVEIKSDYQLLNWVRKSNTPCYRAYFPWVAYGP